MLEKPAATQLPIAELIARRWSPRAIDPNRPVHRDQLLALLEAARWAPSAMNLQPTRFIVARRGTDTFAKIAESLAKATSEEVNDAINRTYNGICF